MSSLIPAAEPPGIPRRDQSVQTDDRLAILTRNLSEHPDPSDLKDHSLLFPCLHRIKTAVAEAIFDMPKPPGAPTFCPRCRSAIESHQPESLVKQIVNALLGGQGPTGSSSTATDPDPFAASLAAPSAPAAPPLLDRCVPPSVVVYAGDAPDRCMPPKRVIVYPGNAPDKNIADWVRAAHQAHLRRTPPGPAPGFPMQYPGSVLAVPRPDPSPQKPFEEDLKGAGQIMSCEALDAAVGAEYLGLGNVERCTQQKSDSEFFEAKLVTDPSFTSFPPKSCKVYQLIIGRLHEPFYHCPGSRHFLGKFLAFLCNKPVICLIPQEIKHLFPRQRSDNRFIPGINFLWIVMDGETPDLSNFQRAFQHALVAFTNDNELLFAYTEEERKILSRILNNRKAAGDYLNRPLSMTISLELHKKEAPPTRKEEWENLLIYRFTPLSKDGETNPTFNSPADAGPSAAAAGAPPARSE